MKLANLLFILVTFSIFLTSFPINNIDNSEQITIESQNLLENSNIDLSNYNSKVTDLFNKSTLYEPEDVLRVTGNINYVEFFTNFSYQYWFIPHQNVEVYIKYNPCFTSDIDTCYPEETNISSYKLDVSSGIPFTNGTGDSQPDGRDDTYSDILNTTGDIDIAYFEEVKSALSYDFYVQLPTETEMKSMAVNGIVNLYEYYPGNTSDDLTFRNWLLSTTSIEVTDTVQRTFFNSTTTPTTITEFSNATTIQYHGEVEKAGSPTINVDNAEIEYEIVYLPTGAFCGTNASSDCSNLGLKVNVSNNDLTDTAGDIDYLIYILNFDDVKNGFYNLTATARFIDPINSANDKSGEPYNIQQNEAYSIIFEVDLTLDDGNISKVDFSGYNTSMFPLDSAEQRPLIRPGDYFSGIVNAFTVGGSANIINSNINFKLYDTLGNNYTDIMYQINTWVNIELPKNSSLTNSLGILEFNISLNYNAPLYINLDLVVEGDFSDIYNTTPYWIKGKTSLNSFNYSFTVDPLYDLGYFEYVRAIPGTSIRPESSGTEIIVEFRAFAVTNSTYKTYADNYGTVIQPTYALEGLPVNASITGGPYPGIELNITQNFASNYLNSSYYYMNSNGYINFTLNSIYPDIYLFKTVNITVIADFSPMIDNNLTKYRFTKYENVSTNISTLMTVEYSIDPDYTVIDIRYLSNNKTGNTNSFTIRPDDNVILFIYETFNTSSSLVVPNVPFDISYIFGESDGIDVSSNTTRSDSNGKIFILIKTFYGITNETVLNNLITFAITLNITLFNETNLDDQYYIGTYNIGNSTYDDYKITWSDSSSSFNINASYDYANIEFDLSIDDYQILDNTPGINSIRPNNITIKITLIAKYDNGTIITGYNIPVKAELYTVYQGVSLTISDSTEFIFVSTDWYNTNTSGYIEFNVTINYDSSILKSDIILLNVTADYSQGKMVCNGCSTDESRWIVGRSAVTGKNMTQSSFDTLDTLSELLTITKGPNYVLGSLTYYSASQVNMFPNTVFDVSYRVRLPNNSVTQADGIQNLPIEGATVYLNQTQLDLYKMSIIENGLVSNIFGIVTFTINATSDVVDGNYTLDAYTEFENDQGLTISGANKTGTFNYFWLNGSTSSLGSINTSISFKNYSGGNSTKIQVKRARTTFTTVNRVFDKNGNLIGTNPDPVEALRDYTFELQVYYRDSYFQVYNESLDLYIQKRDINNNLISTKLSNFTTTVSGYGFGNITLDKTSYLVGSVGIYSMDPIQAGSSIFFTTFLNFSVKPVLSLTIDNLLIENNSLHVYAGEQITVQGRLFDEFGEMGTSFYHSSILTELTDSLVIYGLNTSGDLITGTNNSGSFGFSSSLATYNIIMTFSYGYSLSTLRAYLEINKTDNIANFLNETSLFNGSTSVISDPIYTYQSTTYTFGVTYSNATGGSYNNIVIDVNDSTLALNISGQLKDNYNRIISNRTFGIAWNSTRSPILNISYMNTNATGHFSFDGIIPQFFKNETYLLMIAHIIDNGTAINIWTNTIIRTVFDSTNPVISPVVSLPNYIYQNTSFNFTVVDPSNFTVSTGLNISSLELYRNGTMVWNNSGNFIWIGSGELILIFNFSDLNFITNDAINFTLVITDNSSNLGIYQKIFLFDHINPNITYYPNNLTYIYGSNFEFAMNGSDSETEVDNSTGIVNIDGTDYIMTFNGTYYTYNGSNFLNITSNVTVYFSLSDVAGNTFNSSEIIYLADIIAPIAIFNGSLSYMNNNSYPNQTIIYFIFDVHDNETDLNLTTILIFKDGFDVTGGINANTTVINGNSQIYLNITLPYPITQNITYYIIIFDNNGNNFSSSLVNILYDGIAPNTIFNSTTSIFQNNTYPIQSTIEFSFDIQDPESGLNTSSIIIFRDGFDITLDSTITLSDSQVNITVPFYYPYTNNVTFYFEISDNNGNAINSSIINVLLDLIAPVVTYNTSSLFLNNTYPTSENISFIFDILDNETGLNNTYINIYRDNILVNDGSFVFINNNNQVNITVPFTYPYTQNITYYIQVFDNNLNSTNSSVINVLLDLIAPVVSYNTSSLFLNNTYPTGENISFIFNIQDNETGINNTYINIYRDNILINDGSFVFINNNNQVNITVPFTYPYTQNITFFVQILDKNLNYTNSSIINVLLDDIDPITSFDDLNSLYANNTYPTEDQISFIFNISDYETGLDYSSVLIFNDNNIDLGTVNLINGNTQVNVTVTLANVLTQNTSYYIQITDKNGNKINSSPIIIVADLLAPVLVYDLISSGFVNNSYNLLGEYLFIFNISDDETGLNYTSVKVLKDGIISTESFTINQIDNQVSVTVIIVGVMTSDIIYQIQMNDNNSQLGISNGVLIKADLTAPVILFNEVDSSFLNNSYAAQRQLNFVFQIEDNETGLDFSTIQVLKNGANSTEIYTPIDNDQSISVTIYVGYLPADVYYQVSIIDNNSNLGISGKVYILADLNGPDIILVSPENLEAVYGNSIEFEFSIQDQETDVNSSFIYLVNENSEIVLNNSELNINIQGNLVIISGTITKEMFNLKETNQTFSLFAFNRNNISANLIFILVIDSIGPYSQSIRISSPNITNIINPLNENLTADFHILTFSYVDQGEIETGIDKSQIQIQLVVNGSYTVILTISNNSISVDNSINSNDFVFISNQDNKTVIQWNATNIESYGINKTYNDITITVQWRIIQLLDNYGNSMDVAQGQYVLGYYIILDALPPPPDLVRDVITASLSFAIFLGVGVGTAFIYEKIRYVG